MYYMSVVFIFVDTPPNKSKKNSLQRKCVAVVLSKTLHGYINFFFYIVTPVKAKKGGDKVEISLNVCHST